MMTWPNRITVLRILLLTPFLILLINSREYPMMRYWALGVFAAMALCDALDGHLARRLDQRTRLGAILDPLADKLVLTATVLILTSPRWLGEGRPPYHIPSWVTVTLLSKDGLILIGFLIVHVMIGHKEMIGTTALGKTATALTFVLVLLTLVAPDLARLPGLAAAMVYGLHVLGAVAAGLSAVTCLDYIRRGSKHMAAHSGEEKV
ncbi:MAG: CDP-alcohol phosphatidyltransferase family protein [Planctomycetes bacterium]|nr:CDP-alcohol phosphatidyltransferase family protein [Planctomycetota bacterium]